MSTAELMMLIGLHDMMSATYRAVRLTALLTMPDEAERVNEMLADPDKTAKDGHDMFKRGVDKLTGGRR